MLSTLFLFILFGAGSPAAELYWPAESWRRATAEGVSLDARSLERMADEIRAGNHGETHSLVVIKDGYLVVEEYFPIDPSLPAAVGRHKGSHQLQSATKSVISLAVGVAVGEGLLSEDQRLRTLLPDAMASRKDKWNPTVADLLTMRSGLQWQQWADVPREQLDNIQLLSSKDWIGDILRKPTSDQPGTRFNYSAACPILLAASVAATSGEPFDAWIEKHLFAKLGITTATWLLRDQHEQVHAGGALNLTVLDFARLGYLVLMDGRWNDEQIVPREFLERSVSPHGPTPFAHRPGLMQELEYGYLWWLYPHEERKLIVALGRGEQALLVDREMGLVMALTGWNHEPEHRLKIVDLYLTYIKD